MKKKLISYLLTFAMIFSMIPGPAFAADPQQIVFVDKTKVEVGETVHVQMILPEDIEKVGNFSITMSFNNESFEVVERTPGEAITAGRASIYPTENIEFNDDGEIIEDLSNAQGKFSIAAANANDNMVVAGYTMIDATLKAIAPGDLDLSIDLFQVLLSDGTEIVKQADLAALPVVTAVGEPVAETGDLRVTISGVEASDFITVYLYETYPGSSIAGTKIVGNGEWTFEGLKAGQSYGVMAVCDGYNDGWVSAMIYAGDVTGVEIEMTKKTVVTYTAELDKTQLESGPSAQTVVMTVEASETIEVDGVGMKVIIPDGWKITAIENDVLGFNAGDYNLADGIVVYSTPDAENAATQLLAKITYAVPAGVAADTYELGIENLSLSKDFGEIFVESAAATASLEILPAPGITRAELAVLIAEKFGLEPTGAEHPFTDLGDCTDAEYDAIIALYQAGIVSGTSATTFDPDGVVYGKAAATAIYRAYSGNTTADVDTAVNMLIKEGILNDGEATMEAVTEAKVIEWLDRIEPAVMFEIYGSVEGVTDADIVTIKLYTADAAEAIETITLTGGNDYYCFEVEPGSYTVKATCEGYYESTFKADVVDSNFKQYITMNKKDASDSDYIATLEPATLGNSLETQTVVMTVMAKETIEVDAVSFNVVVPTGWSVKAIENDVLGFTAGDVNLAEGILAYTTSDMENRETQLIAKITYTVPADAPLGTYNLGIKELIMSKDYGEEWESDGAAAAVLDIIHIHKFVPGAYHWEGTENCTVIGTCFCSDTALATAVVTSEVTLQPTCEDMGQTTYTATFAEVWAETQVKTLTDVPETGHTEMAPVEENRVEATCMEVGSYESVVYCDVCDKELSRTPVEIPVDPNAHKYEGAVCVHNNAHINPEYEFDVTTFGTIAYEEKYTTEGASVIVTHNVACKIWYLNGDTPVKLVGTKVEEGVYSFDLPLGVQSIKIAMSGDVTRDGKVNNSDVANLKAYALKKKTLDNEQIFIGDVNNDGKTNNSDVAGVKATALKKKALSW